MKPAGQLLWFRSPVDGRLHPCAVCATDDGPDPKPLLLEVSSGAIRTWSAPGIAALAAFPHPEHADRYVAVHGGTAPDALTFGSHLDMALLPDFLVYAGGEALEWGSWSNDWTAQE